MWELFYLEVVHGKKSWWALLLRLFFRFCSWFYGLAVWLRNLTFDYGMRASRQLDVSVISVGNLSVGGTGKTPIVAFIIHELVKRGLKPGIVSRGYRASEDSTNNDEYLLLSRLCPGIPHAQNRDRFAAARTLVHQNHCDIIVMDDGFQHRQLSRQFDIVLIDASQEMIVNQLLPLGLLREPFTSLRRADFVFITRPLSNPEQTSILRREILRYIREDRLGEIDFKPTTLIDNTGKETPFETLDLTKVGLFCGIGNPESFFRVMVNLGWKNDQKKKRIFPDHHHYSNTDHASLEEWASQSGVNILLTTEKDLVKFPVVDGSTVQIFAVRVIPVVSEGELEFIANLENAIHLRELPTINDEKAG